MPIVVKGDGTQEPFEITKLLSSLKHAGADAGLAEKITKKVAGTIREGDSTSAIYKEAFKILRKEEHVAAARYAMRRAIFELGPTGFPFEDFIASLMQAKGYETKLRVMVPGRCIAHEVDVILRKAGTTAGAELKFHNTPGFKTDLKTALYVRARFWDIQWGAEDRKEENGIKEGWLITNTKFTTNAIEYANCAGIKLLGWDYPNGGSLSDIIKETGVYPVTVLTTLSNAEKTLLLQDGVTMCKMVTKDPSVLVKAGIAGKKHEAIIQESAALCGI